MPIYKTTVSFITKGTVLVQADNVYEAREIIKKGFHGFLGNIEVNDENIKNWDIPTHLDKNISLFKKAN